VNDILEFLNSHASVRNFTDDPISEEQEHIILTTAERSPTSSNLHAYSIISVRDRSTKKSLSELSGGQQHVADSALFLIFCADLYRLSRLTEDRGYPFSGEYTESFIIATVDAALAGGRALQAAQALGLGGVMVGGIRNEPKAVSNLLKLPRLVYPVFGMSLGKPVRQPTIKPRLPLAGLCFKERYDDSAFESAVAEYDRTIDEVGYLKGHQVEAELYPNFKGLYSWSEHSARRMASKKRAVVRPHLLSFLNGRGFLRK